VDPSHQLVELFGFTNIPFGLWVDENGTIVRPSDVAFGPSRRDGVAGAPPDQEGQRQQNDAMNAALQRMTPEQRQAAQRMFSRIDRSGRYVDAVRDWVAKGSASQYVLAADEVIQRSRPRPAEFGMAAAEFELAQHLHRAGFGRDAVAHFKEAHRLDPANWSYFRQALAVADADWGQVYERGDVMSELAVVGPETFYPPLDLYPVAPA
jgi:hypothetical protein